MAAPEELLDDLAGAILDGRPIDWKSAESAADEGERALLDPLRILATLADLHRHPSRAPYPNDQLLPSNAGAEPESDEHRIADLSGEMVGAYRLIEPLGRGGMGEVYLGERADGRFEQEVAVKLVKRGMDSREILRRFARERRILARLEHPGIARLLDAGETSDGRPYFVIERVQGERITDYCRLRALPLEDRLHLVASCCDAADAAHRSLVVHRDLKPSNILVTPDGQVKLLDFGIAKLLGDEEVETQLTRHGGRVLTAAYAAPEQILGGDVTMATDVFALGVVLYEVLTGALPYERRVATPQELVARVEHETAERPSTMARRTTQLGEESSKQERWARRLRGDLDTITMKALAHEPVRRYPSAAALADDLRRYLTSRPVEAQPDSKGYRLRKFVTRHRLGVAASGVVATAVVVALAVSLAQMAAARRQAERATAAQAFLTSLFEQIDPARSAGSPPTVRDLLERGSERVDRELSSQPELRAEMQVLLGQVFDQLSLPQKGEAQWRRALETRQALFGPGDARTAKAKKGLAISLARQARYTEAEPLFQELLAHEQVLADPREMGSVLLNYGNHKRLTGDYVTSEALLERAVALLGSAEPDSQPLARALNNLGLIYWRHGRERDAVNAIERSLAIQVKYQGRQSGAVAPALMNLALLHRELDELDAAERYAQEALAVTEAVYPANHPLVGATLEALGTVAQKRGDRDRARALYNRSISSFEGSARPDHPDLAGTLCSLAGLLREEGAIEEALRLSERALTLRRKALGDRHPDVARSWHDLGRSRLAVDDLSGALEALRNGIDIFRSTLPPDSSQLAGGLFLLGDVLRGNHRPGEALPYLEDAHAIWRKKPPSNPRNLTELEAAITTTRAALR